MAKFDATDLKYQVSEDYKPDKVSTWKHAEENDGWVIGTFLFFSFALHCIGVRRETL